MMKIYVASSWRNEYQPAMVQGLRRHRELFDVYDFRNPREGDHGFAWSQISERWKEWTTREYVEALDHELAVKGFASDMDALRSCDACVLVLPAGRSANLEAGWAVGAGRPLAVWSPVPQEPELMYKMADLVTGDRLDVEAWAINLGMARTAAAVPA